MAKQRKLFCERNALFFEISQKKGILLFIATGRGKDGLP